MSTQITTAFTQQFSANIQMLSQQKGSLLRRAVSEESVTGEKAFFDQVGSATAAKKTSRHSKICWSIRLRNLVEHLVATFVIS